ncbi:MAG TPA: PrgI family protein [Candidatus Saccharimonadia bacterium]|nr:PrgI family protein [Candidatus Saccharimonadia bacterium]
MQEHPVPQNVTSYEFHLIGNMTLKQFLELASGGVLAFVAYSSNLPGIIKWPIMLTLVGVGIAMAFLPIEERPLDTWFLAFLRAIYNPTKFHWKKKVKVPDIFDYTMKQSTPVSPDNEVLTKPQRESRIAAYFQSIAPAANDESQEDVFQHALSITQMYDSVPAAKDVLPAQRKVVEPLEKPSVSVKPHQLQVQEKIGTSGTITISEITKAPTEDLRGISLPTVLPTQNLVSRGPVSVVDAGAAPLKVGQAQTIEKTEAPTKSTTQYRSAQAELQASDQDLTAVQTSKTLPFPKTPTAPNVVVGMVLDKDGKILENAIVEIRTIQGFPARALKSNRLGQFFASTPLPVGEYEIVVEKDGYTFQQEKLSVDNKVILPLEIRSN